MISCSSAIASSAPPTSLKVTPTSSAFTSVALLLPTPKIPPPAGRETLRPAIDHRPSDQHQRKHPAEDEAGDRIRRRLGAVGHVRGAELLEQIRVAVRRRRA